MEFEKGQRIIWDDLYRYEIGLFVGKGDNPTEYTVLFKSGVCCGKTFSVPKE